MGKQYASLSYESINPQIVSAGQKLLFNSFTNTDKVSFIDGCIKLCKPGVYFAAANATAIATVGQIVEMQLFDSEDPLPGAHAIETVDAVTDCASMFLTKIVRAGQDGLLLSVRSLRPGNFAIVQLSVVEL